MNDEVPQKKPHVMDNPDFQFYHLPFHEIPDTVESSWPCLDCDQLCQRESADNYLVYDDVWEEAGLKGWKSGRLHRKCLEKRLGRTLAINDLFMWTTPEGKASVRVKDVPRLKEVAKAQRITR